MEQKDTIDFSPLKDLRNSNMNFAALYLLLIILSPIFITLIGEALFDTEILGVSYLCFFILLGLFIVDLLRKDKKNKTVIENFTKANNWQFEPVSHSINKPGTVFSIGNSRVASRIISGTMQNLPFYLYSYVYSIGSGKSKQSYDLQVFEITLPRKLPHMVIDSLVESGNAGSSTLPIDFAKSQKIELEGDFSQYFSLYAPDKYGIAALTILAPDTMEALMNFAAKCDIEIVQNKLYFYWPKPGEKQKDFEEFFATVSKVLDKTIDKLTSSDIYATAEQVPLHASPTDNGARLKSSWWNSRSRKLVYLGLVMAMVINTIVFKDDTVTKINTGLLFVIAAVWVSSLVSIIINTIIRKQKQSQLKERMRSLK